MNLSQKSRMNHTTRKRSKSIKKLKQEITIAREQLNRTWNVQGCTDDAVLEAAAKLDTLLNQYQRIINGKS